MSFIEVGAVRNGNATRAHADAVPIIRSHSNAVSTVFWIPAGYLNFLGGCLRRIDRLGSFVVVRFAFAFWDRSYLTGYAVHCRALLSTWLLTSEPNAPARKHMQRSSATSILCEEGDDQVEATPDDDWEARKNFPRPGSIPVSAKTYGEGGLHGSGYDFPDASSLRLNAIRRVVAREPASPRDVQRVCRRDG